MKRTGSYTRTAIVMHWSMALLLFVAFPLGVLVHEMSLSPDKLRMLSYHKWLGVTIFILAVIRLLWRMSHKPAALPATMPQWQRLAAQGVHMLLYVLLFVIPLSGWLMSSAKGFQTVYFGIIPLPDLLTKDKALGEALAELHEMLNAGLLVLLIAHIAAALKHQLVDRDGTLTRMLPMVHRKNTK